MNYLWIPHLRRRRMGRMLPAILGPCVTRTPIVPFRDPFTGAECLLLFIPQNWRRWRELLLNDGWILNPFCGASDWAWQVATCDAKTIRTQPNYNWLCMARERGKIMYLRGGISTTRGGLCLIKWNVKIQISCTTKAGLPAERCSLSLSKLFL